ncbi:MAG: tetraacyldisaccharide 4'-kinase [Planctomycetaceae bacterium]|jgi:tetraacyldisaccharide 4'-kinase|nr:tetraacyldisaccharide 4'-kinase [bacterium]MDB4679694.1 tetraacyldisaccharide 4'-kinase [Planctomycetaceae bacterium]MDG2391773.1 tetraacyldisaccharide 4'-kinase [Planctomycetaceae bacterium]
MATDAFLSIISGKQLGLLAACLRGFLHPVSYAYGIVVRVRNCLFDSGLKRSYTVPLKVISIGNLTTGGTGKTPVVAEIANRLTKQGVKTGLLSRGYRSLSTGENDEKLVLDRLCPGVSHWQNPDRVVGAAQAKAEDPELDALVLDDAFQHRRINRDLDIVLIDATNPWGYGYQLPRGLLRESKAGLKRADLIVLTRADQITESELSAMKQEIGFIASDVPLMISRFRPTGWLTLDGSKVSLEELTNKPMTACCGIGNPDGFRNTLCAIGCDVKSFVEFADHHHYDEQDIASLAGVLKQEQVETLVMTLKDLVKFPQHSLPEFTVAALLIEWDILEGEEALEKLIAIGQSDAQ